MSNAVIGALRAILGADTAAFEKGMGAAERRMAAFNKRMAGYGQRLQSIGNRMSIGITAPVTAAIYKSIEAQKTQERAVAAVDAALQSMGNGAGFAREQLFAMASELQAGSLYGDEKILQKVTANLLTFGNVSGDVFARAQQMAVDLSARLGTDLQSSAIMLGKALNDPKSGLTALTRVGVSFTEQQQKQIKAMAEAGDVAGAQALMLAELERQYKGQAAALAGTDSGRIQQAWMAIGDAMERVGAIVLPVLAQVADRVKAWAEAFQNLDPGVQRVVVTVGLLAAAIGPLLSGLGLFLMTLGPLAAAIAALASPVGLVVAGVAALAAGAALIVRNWDHIAAWWADKWEGMRAETARVVDDIRARVTDMIPEPVKDAGRFVVEQNVAAFRVLQTELAAVLNRIVFDGDAAKTTLGAQWASVPDLFRSALAGVGAVFDEMWQGIKAKFTGWIADVQNLGAEIVRGLRAGITAHANIVTDAVGGLAERVKNRWRRDTKTESPSKVFMEFGQWLTEGLAIGIDRGTAQPVAAMEATAQRIAAAVQGGAGVQQAMAAMTAGTAGLQSGIQRIGNTAGRVFETIGQSLAGLGTVTETWRGALANVARTLAQVLAQQAQAAIVQRVGGAGSIMGQVVNGLFGGLFRGQAVRAPSVPAMTGAAMGNASLGLSVPRVASVAPGAAPSSAVSVKVGFDATMGAFRASVLDAQGKQIAAALEVVDRELIPRAMGAPRRG